MASKNYSHDNGKPAYFKAPLVINCVQSMFAVILGVIYTSFKIHRPFHILGYLRQNSQLVPSFFLIALSQAVSSPIAYSSLNNVDYLFYLLAKSCKLIPVMLVHLVLYHSRFPAYKYMAAMIITLGVIVFTLGSTRSAGNSSIDGNYLVGLLKLTCSLLLDGFTNSSQDQLFKKSRISGAQLMAVLNGLNLMISAGFSLVATNQWQYFVSFIQDNGPEIVRDVVSFGLLGSLGQIFIFVTLERFSSMVLVTVTVTRKMLSLCLSVVLFGHSLRGWQWGGLLLVAVGITLEAVMKNLYR